MRRATRVGAGGSLPDQFIRGTTHLLCGRNRRQDTLLADGWGGRHRAARATIISIAKPAEKPRKAVLAVSRTHRHDNALS
ncbi:hypothetical protein BF49_2202 [Bradyrhizobium sp.]|nr:hypothetical protein BF49_2202 [Bradyrhizobium sp.]